MMKAARATSAGSSPASAAALSSSRERLLDEDPLHLGLLVREERAHEGPVAGGVEPPRRHGPRGRYEALGRRPAQGLAGGAVMDHGLAGPRGAAALIEREEEHVGVASALVRVVRERGARMAIREVAHRRRPARQAARDGPRRARHQAHELVRAPVAVARAPAQRHRIAVTLQRKLDRMSKRAVARATERRARAVVRQRSRARARRRSRGDQQRDRGRGR